MQQFVVPQFIDVEDKIFGPITTRQFLILLVGGVIVFVMYRFADFSLFITSLILIGGGALVLAFIRINGQPFHFFLVNIILSTRRPSLRIWRKSYSKSELDYLRNMKPEERVEKEELKPVERERMRDLALLVNTGGYYRPEE